MTLKLFERIEEIDNQLFWRLGLVSSFLYALTVLPYGYMYFRRELFFVILLSIPLLTLFSSFFIGYKGYKKESVAAVLSMFLSPAVFFGGLMVTPVPSISFDLEGLAVWTSLIMFLGIPWLAILKFLVQEQRSS